MLKFSKEKLQPQPTQNNKPTRKTTNGKKLITQKTNNPTNQLKTQMKCWNFPKRNYNPNQHKTKKKQPRKTPDWKKLQSQKYWQPNQPTQNSTEKLKFSKRNYNLNQPKTTNQSERQLTGKN